LYLFRCLLLFAWSNSSISPLSYLLLLPKCSYLCSLCCSKNRSSTYDSLTSYYNRIGDRFHDIGKWDQFNIVDEQQINKNKNKFSRTTTQTEDETDQYQHFKLKQFNLSNQNNSLFVKEISNNQDDTSSLSSLTTITNKQHHLSNGLLVTTNKHNNL